MQRYLVKSMRRGGPLRTETMRATEFKPQFILVYWVFTVFSVCTAVLVVFYQGLPAVYCVVPENLANLKHKMSIFVLVRLGILWSDHFP